MLLFEMKKMFGGRDYQYSSFLRYLKYQIGILIKVQILRIRIALDIL